MRVLKRKAAIRRTPTSSIAALRKNPVFPSLYGGNASTVGTIAFDTDTHSVKHRPMMVAQFKNGKVNQLAHFDIGGATSKCS
jgi:branched-chain amino acid transport system substrate-binding protein